MRTVPSLLTALILTSTTAAPVFAQDPPPQLSAPPPKAITYSDGYYMRAKIHKVASLATLPLFVTEGIVGQSLYSNPTEGKKGAHLAIATGMGALFGVNSVTGVWNLVEARKDPNHRGKRLAHAILMLAADGGFLATAATGPHVREREGRFVTERPGSPAAHRAIAFTSIGLATTGYVIMLFGGH